MKQQHHKLRNSTTIIHYYWCKLQEQVSSSCCDSLFFEHCSSENLEDHFSHFKKDIQLDTPCLLQLSMDCPNGNKSFQENLPESIDEFLNLGMFHLHTSHSSFQKGISGINFDFD